AARGVDRSYLERLPRRDELTQRADGAELDAADRALTLADEVRDLLRAESLEEAEDDDLLLQRRELRERLAERVAVGARQELDVRLDDLVGGRMVERVLERHLAIAAARAIDHGVARDAIEPGEERLTRLVSWHRLQRSHEHVAREILRFGVVTDPVVDVPVDRGDVPVIEEAEGRDIAAGGPDGKLSVLVLPYRRNGVLGGVVRSHLHRNVERYWTRSARSSLESRSPSPRGMESGYPGTTYAPGSTIDWRRYSTSESPGRRVAATVPIRSSGGPAGRNRFTSCGSWQEAQPVSR